MLNKPCCETAHNQAQHLEIIAQEVKKLRRETDKLYERVKYYDEELSEQRLWEITQELKKLTDLTQT